MSSRDDEITMIVDMIEAFQPQTSVTVYRGIIYVNGEPLERPPNKRRKLRLAA